MAFIQRAQVHSEVSQHLASPCCTYHIHVLICASMLGVVFCIVEVYVTKGISLLNHTQGQHVVSAVPRGANAGGTCVPTRAPFVTHLDAIVQLAVQIKLGGGGGRGALTFWTLDAVDPEGNNRSCVRRPGNGRPHAALMSSGSELKLSVLPTF